MHQKCLIYIFFRWNLKTILWNLKSATSNLSNCKLLQKNKNASVSDQKCLIWVFLGENFWKPLSYLKSAPWNFPNCKIFWRNKNALILVQKCLNYFWRKMLSLRIFWLELQKNLWPYLKSAPLNLSNFKIFGNNENA